MDKRVLRERMRRKKRQMMIRRYTKLGLYVVGLILAVVFVIRGIIVPIAHHVAGGGSGKETVMENGIRMLMVHIMRMDFRI